MSGSDGFAMPSLRRRLAQGVGWVALAMLANALINIASSMLLSRLLDPEVLGSYFLASSAAAIGAMVAQLGMARVMVRQVSESMARNIPAESRRVIRTVLVISLATSGIIGAIIAGGIGRYVADVLFELPHLLAVVPLVALWIILATFQGLIPEAFRGLHDLRFASLFGGMVSGLFVVMCLAFLWSLDVAVNLYTVLSLTLVGVALSLSLSGILLYRRLSILPWEPGLCLRKVVMSGIPVLGTGLLMLVMRDSHAWLLGMLGSASDVAQLGVVLRLILAVTLPLLLVNQAIQSAVAHLHAKDDFAQLEQLLRGTSTAIVLVALPVLFVMITWGDAVLGIVFGDYYRASYHVLTLVIVGHVVNLWTGSAGVLLVMAGRERVQLAFVLVAVVFSIGVSALLIPAYGVNGAAVGISVGLVIQNMSMWIYCWRAMGLRTDPNIHHFLSLWKQFRKQFNTGRSQV